MKYLCRPPGPRSRKIIARDHKVVSGCLTREYSFVFRSARGCDVVDVDGRRYLDFSAGVAVANTGHANPEIMKAIRQQTRKAAHCAFADFYAGLPVEFIELLLTVVPDNLEQAFLSNSGTEAIEAGYKLARWHTNRKWFIAFRNAFHGRTMGSLSMTNSQPVQRERYGPFLPVKHVDFPYFYRCPHRPACRSPDDCGDASLSQLDRAVTRLKGEVAGVFVEPIQGEGGYIVPPAGFHKRLRRLCTEQGILLCDDEVQAGCYRTGTFLAMEQFGVKPDIVCLSKAVGGGIPLGATLSSRKIMDWPPGSHANTFGGNLLACAAGIASLKFMRKKKLGLNATKVGSHMMNILTEMKEKYGIIGDVRGKGLMIGVEIVKTKKTKQFGVEERHQILCRAMEKGLILLPAGRSTIRMCPPLILTREQAEKGLDIFEEAVRMAGKHI